MRQYLYISTAIEPTDGKIEDILNIARARNAQNGITGLLLFNGRNFMQLIEGMERDLRDLLGSLSQDRRHTGMTLLAENPVAVRACPDWAMDFLRFGGTMNQRRAAIAGHLPATIAPVMRDAMLGFAALE